MKYNFKNIVFEGGGIKCICYGGALTELQSLGMLKNIERVAGTSAGAITACLLAVGYTPEEISKIIGETNFKKFEDDTFFIIRDIIRLLKSYGWNKGDNFQKWIGELIKAKTGNDKFTFGELKEANIYKDLYIVCTNITTQRPEILSHETTPEMSICEAVRMSMSIPLYFTAVKNKNGDIIVDGGVTWNYPINIFDNVKYLSNPINGIKVDDTIEQGYAFNYETLGFKVDSTNEINYAKQDWELLPEKVKGIKSFIGALMNFTMEMVNKKHLHKNDWNRTVFIDSLDVKTTDFKLSKQKVSSLIENGQAAVKSYFLWKDNDLIWSNFPKC